MRKNIHNPNWRMDLDEITPETMRVGDDLLLIENYSMLDFMFEPFRTDVTTAVFYHEGEYDISINMQRFHVKAPCLLLMLCDQTVQCHPVETLPRATSVVLSRSVTDDLITDHSEKGALYQSALEHPLTPFPADHLPTVELYLASLRETLRHTENPNRLEAAKHLTRAFFLNMPQLKKHPFIAKDRSNELMFDFLKLLQQHFRTERSIEFYAGQLCLSPKYLSKVVKQVSDRTVHYWIDEYLVTEAKALLHSTDMTVSQVADDLGFVSQPVFSRFFHKNTGTTPLQFRKQR